MKHISIAFLIALGLGLIFTSKSQVGEPFVKLNEKEPLLFDSITSIFVKSKVEEISTKHKEIPLFFVFDGKLFFIKSNTDRIDDSMFVNNIFGIINQNSEVILEQKYDKIYNPNFTISNCVEIAQNGKVGLFNLKTNQIISPQFEYIVPSGNTPSNIAYGLNGNEWFEINSETMQQTPAPNYSPEKFLSELDMEVNNTKFCFYWTEIFNLKSKYYDFLVYYNIFPEIKEIKYDNLNKDTFEIVQSYLYPSFYYSHLIETLTNNKICKSLNTDIIGVGGLENVKIKSKTKFKFNDLSTFILSTVEDIVIPRMSYSESIYITQLNGTKLISKFFYDYTVNLNFNKIKYLSKNLILSINETSTQYNTDNSEIDSLFNIKYYQYPIYNFFKMSENLELDSIKSNRYYNFTEFVKIDDSYFKNKYYKFLDKDIIVKNYDTIYYPDEDSIEVNSIIYNHLRIKDLELMKNEILADNGCKFKDKKLTNFFNRFAWYKPKYELKELKLSEIDKYNLNFINKRIKSMKGKEKLFTKPEYYLFVAAG